MSIHLSTVRRLLYHEARLLGDINAIQKNRLPQRILRRLVYRQAGRVARRLIKPFGL